MSRTDVSLKFKMCLFLDEACSWAEKLLNRHKFILSHAW